MAKRRKRRYKKILRSIIVLIILVALSLLLTYLAPYIKEHFGEQPREPIPVGDGEYIEIHVIDVGQGDSILVSTSAGYMLIDSGPSSAEQDLKNYLDEMDVEKIEYAVFTHPDADHIGNADMILTDYTVSNVIMPGHSKTTQTYRNMIDAFNASGAELIAPEPSYEFEMGAMTVTILGPIEDNYKSTNDYSVVMRLDFGETSFMMTGDAEEVAEEDILGRFGTDVLDCDVLKVGHHGSSTSTTKEFLDAVSPELAVISCGEGNKYGHPHAETLSKLTAASAEIYRTDEWGSVVLVSDGTDITVQPKK